MKPKTFTPMGSLHPILFFAVVYIVALLASIFICSSLFYSCNANKTENFTNKKSVKAAQPETSASTVVYRQK